MKTIVRNNQVPHLWAHQSQSYAKGNGSISFYGKTLFSYGVRIGQLVEAPNGDTVALLISRKWSNTTTGHQSYARSAVSHMISFVVPDIDNWAPDHAGNLTYLVKQYDDEKASCFRKRNMDRWYYEHLLDLAQTAKQYAEVFGLPLPAVDYVTDQAAIEAFHNSPEKQAKRVEREAQVAEQEVRAAKIRVALDAERLAKWRLGADVYGLRDAQGNAYVRVVGDTLQTSQGAEVPLADAIRVFRFVMACKQAGRCWTRNGETIQVGAFQVDRINADGSFKAGCHSFAWDEIEQAARALWLTV